MKNSRAFTLIELLVVVLIIGILAAVAVPQYQKAVYKSRVVEAISMLKALQQAQEAYYLANGDYTDDLSKLDVEIPSNLIASGWISTEASNPQKYLYSCAANGQCAGNAANPQMPIIEMYPFHAQSEYAGRLHCCPYFKDGKAEEVCKMLGTFSHQYVDSHNNKANYYQIN
ncbi:MAG: prepilin-type N-terminal cleavage/methylation domain-containing protein [Elusimicrobiaceae bacterium]|nr:prepilin-type N-terminal cleavage/methylation domain-containing protein [Elusimicrobiaceae bacterium]